MFSRRGFGILLACFLVSSLVGCGGGDENADKNACKPSMGCKQCCDPDTEGFCSGDGQCSLGLVNETGGEKGSDCAQLKEEDENVCYKCADKECTYGLPSHESKFYDRVLSNICCKTADKPICIADDECGPIPEEVWPTIGDDEGFGRRYKKGTAFCFQVLGDFDGDGKSDGKRCVLGDPSSRTADIASKYQEEVNRNLHERDPWDIFSSDR